MAKVRRAGFGTVFQLEETKVGIGTTVGNDTFRVLGDVTTSNANVINVATVPTYKGFLDNETRLSSNEVDLDNIVGYVNGEPYYGDFHVHNRSDGTQVNMVGSAHTTLKHAVIGEESDLQVDYIGGDIIIDGEFTISPGASYCSSVDQLTATSNFTVPTGTTDDRVHCRTAGSMRFNEDLGTLEFYTGQEWRTVNSFKDTGNRGRGFYVGGFEPGIGHDEITYFNTSSRGNAVMFGDLSFAQYSTCGGASNQTRGLIQGTSEPSTNDQKTEYFTMASEGNGITFGELTVGRGYGSGTASATRSLCAGGYASPANVNVIDYAEIATIGNHLDFGDLSAARTMPGATNTPVRSVFINGGSPSSPTGAVIDFVTTASLGNAVDFGSFAIGGNNAASSHANHTRSITAVRSGIGAYALDLTSGGNQFVFADLVEPYRDGCFNTGNMVRAVIAGGFNPGYSKNMEEVLISSGGSATDFGDAVFAVSGGSSFSDSHGGLGGY